MPTPPDLRVEKAAIKTAEGTVWSMDRPNRHCNIIWKIVAESGVPSVHGETQGFLLSDGRFATRKASAYIAIKNGQIKELKWPPYLYSEDLW